MRIAICEDELPSRDFEANLVRGWAERKNIKIFLDTFSSAENFLFESEDRLEYDLLLLDIQMGKMNGFELAKTLRKRGFSGQLAFITGIMDFALEGYEVGAVRYILKPVHEENLFQTLDIVYSDFCKKNTEVFLLQTGNDVYKIPFSNIFYIESRGHYVHLVGNEKNEIFEKEWKSTFSSVEAAFENKSFFCLRRGFLVNLSHIQRITKTECFLDNGEIIPIARGKYEELNRAFIDFYREQDS